MSDPDLVFTSGRSMVECGMLAWRRGGHTEYERVRNLQRKKDGRRG